MPVPGATIKRVLEPIDPILKKLFNTTERYVFASYEDAKELVEFKDKTEIKIRVRTIQGTYKTRTPIFELFQTPTNYLGKEKFQTGFEYQDHVKIGFQFIKE